MAKSKKQPRKNGPYLAAAFFCDNVLEEKDGTLSAVRMLDQIKVTVPASAPDDFPSEENKVPLAMAGLLSFKSGESPGPHTVRLEMESPTGKVSTAHEQTIPFAGQAHGGGNLILRFVLRVNKGGLFWFNVYLDNKLMTTMPLQVTVEREQPTQATSAAQPLADSSAALPTPAMDSSSRRPGKDSSSNPKKRSPS
jgi:hypothetical protein